MNNNIYEDEFYRVSHVPEYPLVPGFYVIYAKQKEWYTSILSTNRLSELEKKLREELLQLGFDLMGIYREESQDSSLRVFILPYDVSILEKNDISPDLYQPYIEKYLQSFDNTAQERVVAIDLKIKMRLNERRG